MKFYPTYLQSFGLLLIFFLCSILSVLVLIPFFSFDSGIAMSIMYVLSTSLTIGAALVIRKDYSFLLNRFSPVIVLIASVTLLSIHLFLDPLTNLIPLSDTLKKMLVETIRQPAVFFFMIVIAAPILEELLFRGVILDGLLKNYQPVHAILFSAFLFALVHGNLAQGIGAFLGGILMGWIYWKTQSVIPGILIHFFNNLAAFVGTMLTPEQDIFKSTFETIGNPITYWLLIVGAGIIAGVRIWLLHQKYFKNINSAFTKEASNETV